MTVSRLHAKIIIEKRNIFIEDLNSKFGTLVNFKNHIRLKKKSIFIQSGRTSVELYLTKTFKSYILCESFSFFLLF